jgi:hypothetical protein
MRSGSRDQSLQVQPELVARYGPMFIRAFEPARNKARVEPCGIEHLFKTRKGAVVQIPPRYQRPRSDGTL